MRIFLGLLGFVIAYFMVIKREAVGDMFGDADWMQSVGGIYNVVLLMAVIVFLVSIAAVTNTFDIFFAPLFWLLPKG